MELADFIDKYLGKKVDFDNANGATCVDLARQWIQEGWEIKEHTGPCATSGGAKDLWLDYEKMPLEVKYMAKAKVPNKGDLVVFNATEKNKYGHVAIIVSAVGDRLSVFEQDGFKQNGAKFGWWKVDNVLGYLRRR